MTGTSDKVWDLNAIRNSKVYAVSDRRLAAGERVEHAGRSLLAVAYLHGRGLVRDRLAFVPLRRRGDGRQLASGAAVHRRCAADDYNAGRPISLQLRLPFDRRNGIKADTGLFAQDRWVLGRVTLNLGIRYDWFLGETQKSEILPSRLNTGIVFDTCSSGQNDQTPAASVRSRTGRTSHHAWALRGMCLAMAGPR